MKVVLLPLLLASCLCTKLHAQTETVVFDSSIWKSLSERNTYTETNKKEEHTVLKTPEAQTHHTAKTGWIWIAVVCILLLASGIMIYRLKQPAGIAQPDNTLLQPDTPADPKWHMPSIAFHEGNSGLPEYNFRMQYIRILQQLAGRGLIVYRRDKTNMDYVRELKGHRLYPEFSELTFHFNRIRYGHEGLDPVLSEHLETVVLHIENALKKATNR